MEPEDIELLTASLQQDEHHAGTGPEFFWQEGAVTKVYSDEAGPIMFVRGTKALRIDIQFLNNGDLARNRQAMVEGFPAFVERAKAAGFTELIFDSDVPLLKRFCKREFGFVESKNGLRRYL